MNKINNSDDKKISELLQKELPEAGKDQWFTKRVLNRLPPYKPRYSIGEKVLTTLCCLILLVGLILESVHIATSPVLLVGDLMMMGVLFVSSLALAGWIVYPLLKN